MTHAETEAEKYERKVFGLNHSRAENIDPKLKARGVEARFSIEDSKELQKFIRS